MPAGARPDPPAHTLRIAVNGTYEAAPWANVFWVRNGGGQAPTPVDLTPFANNFLAAYATNLLPYQSTASRITLADVLYYLGGGEVRGGQVSSSAVGAIVGTAAPASTSIGISWIIQQRYRGGHPRTYLPGIAITQLSDNTTINPSTVSAIQNAARGFHAAVNALAVGNLQDIHLGSV